jgi:hypothetical protein
VDPHPQPRPRDLPRRRDRHHRRDDRRSQTLAALRQLIYPSFAAIFDTDNFDLRPLHNPVANIVYGSTGHSVDTVLIGGQVVLRHKELTTLDERELRNQVEAINRRVLGEIGIAPLPKWPII